LTISSPVVLSSAPGVVVGDEDDPVGAVAGDGEEVVPPRRAHRPGRKALPLYHHPLAELGAQPVDELLDLTLVPLIATFPFERPAVAADVLEDFGDTGADGRVAGVDGVEDGLHDRQKEQRKLRAAMRAGHS